MGGARAKRGIVALLVGSVIASGLATTPAEAQVAGPGAELAAGLDSFVGALTRAGASEVLMEPLPLSVRSVADVLSISPALVGSLRATLGEQILQDPSFSDLEAAIDGADAEVAGATAAFESTITPAPEGDGATVVLDISITSQQDVPVAYREAQIVDEDGVVVDDPEALIAADPEAIINEDVIVSLAGDATQAVSVTAELETSVTFAFDPAAPLASQLRVIDPLPTIAVTVTGEADDLVLDGAYGFADLITAGRVDYALSVTAQLVDPDGIDGVHRSEWETTLPDELFPLARRDVPETSDVDVALTFDSPQVSGDEDGTLTWDTADASTGLGAPTRTVTAPLEQFRNLTAADALVATTQLATTIGSLHEQGDVELPFTDSMLSRSFSPATAFHDVVAELAVADIRCGHANTSPPQGDEETGGTWYCQAYTDEDPEPGSVQWDLVGDGELTEGSADTTVGASPTSNVTVTGSQDRPDVRVTWTAADEAGGTKALSARARFRTAGELEAALAEGLGAHLPEGASVEVELGEWDGHETETTADDTIEYSISISADPEATTDARLAIGDAARAASGLSGVRAASEDDAEVSVDLDDVTLDLVFGVSLADDLAGIAPDEQDSRSDRFYVRAANEDGVALRVGGVTAGPSATSPVHAGQVGFLGVDVAIDGLDLAKTDADADAVTVTLKTPDSEDAGTNTIGGDARLLRHLIQRPDLHSDAAFNLETSGTFSVTPAGDLDGIVSGGDQTLAVSWSPLEPGSRPAFTPSDSFLTDLRPFDISPTVTGFATEGTEVGTLEDDDEDPQTPHIAVGTFLEDAGQDFTRAFGFEVTPSEDLEDAEEIAERSQVAGTLLNITTGASCQLFEVVTPTTLECVDGLVGGVARDPERGDTQLEEGGDNAGAGTIDNSWHPGDRYEVAGDATALGRMLVEGAGDLANDLEQNEALDARIPIVGVPARDLVPQLAEVLDDTLVPILERIAESHVDETTGLPNAITTLQQLQSAFDDAGVDASLTVEALATPLSDELVPHLVLRIGSLDHTDTIPLADLETELSARALRLQLPDPVPEELPEASVTSSVQLDLGVPLSLHVSSQRLLVLATTGVRSASLTFDETELDLTGTYGPLRIIAGQGAVMNGTAENPTGTHDAVDGTISGIPTITGTATGGSATTLTDSTKDFVELGLVAGGTLTRTAGGTCTVSTVAQHTLTCAPALATAFASGDTYSYDHTSSRGQLSTTTDLGDVLAGDHVVSGAATCEIAVVGADHLICDDPSTSAFAVGDSFTIESPRRVRYSGVDLSAYGNGDRLVNLDEDATCTVTGIDATSITCSSSGLSGGARFTDGDSWSLEKGDSGSTLFVSGAGFDGLAVEGGTVQNLTDGSSCTITSTTADTATCEDGLTGGTKDRWANGDEFELGGVAAAQIDATLSLLHEDGTTADPVLLDGAAEVLGDLVDAPTFQDVLDLDLEGPNEPNRCGAPEPFGGDACFRLGFSMVEEDGTATFLGVAEWAADVDGGNASGSAPANATAAVSAAEISIPELATATVLLSDLLGAQLDGYNVPTADALEGAWDPSSTLLPLVGADLSAAGGHDDGQSVEDSLLALGGALAGLEDLAPDAIDTASELQAAIDALLLDESLSGFGVGQIGTATVTCYSGATETTCGEDLRAEDDVRVGVKVGRNLDATGTAPDKGCTACAATSNAAVPFDIGLPGLEFVADATVESRYAWKLDLGFGISRANGPYLFTGGADEFVLGAQVGIPDGVNTCDTAEKIGDNDVPSNTPDNAVKPSEFSATRCFDAQLGLLEATVYDGNTDLTGHEAKDGDAVDWASDDQRSERTRLDLRTSVELAGPGGSDRLDLIDLLDGDHASTTLVDADANVDLWFVTGKELTGGNLPQIQGGLHYAFDQDQMLSCEDLSEALDFEEGSDEQSAFDEACTGESRYPMVGDIEFTDLVMDLRTFFSDLLGPWVADVAGVIGVVRPVADYLLTPIPGLSQLAELTGQPPVTAFALMQEVSGNSLTFIYNLLEFVQFADVIANGSAETVNDDDGIIGIGGTTVDEFGFPTSEIGGVGAITSSGGYKYDTSEARSVGPCGAELPTIGGHRGGSITKRFKPKDCQKSHTKVGKGGQKSKGFADASLTGFSRNKQTESIKQLRSCPRGGATSGTGARPGASRCTGKELARTVSKNSGVELSAPGLWFPFLADANVMFGMLHGMDAQLVRLDLGTLKASAGLSIGFGPFMAGPVPIEIGIGGSIAASMRTMVGLDTLGLRTTGKLMDGFFIEDLDPYTQYDVYELQVVFTISVYAAVSIRFIKAGLEGEIELGIGANLQDPDGDGRVRPDELTMYGGDWWCAFLLEGYISFVARVFIELDFKLWSKKWAYDLFRKSWLLFTIQCEPDPPALAVEVDSSNAAAISEELTTAAGATVTVSAGDLVLNAGPRADERNVDEDETEETFTLRQMEPEGAGSAACPPSTDTDGDGDYTNDSCPPPPVCPGASETSCTGVLIDAFGLSQEYRVGTGGRVVAVTEGGSDFVSLLEGSGGDEAVTHPFVLPSLIHLGGDQDGFTGGDGADIVDGGGDRDVIEAAGGSDQLQGGDGPDSLKGDAGDDRLDGGAGNDRMAGGPGADVLLGGAEDDSLTGGPGLAPDLADRIARLKFPQEANETDEAWEDRVQVVVRRVADSGDAIVGGSGSDEISGQVGDDLLVGDELDGYTGAVDLTLAGKAADATATAELCAATTGTGAIDHIEGATGDDTIVGGPGNDALMGGRGDDLLCGLAGQDEVQGDDESPLIPGGDDDLRGGDDEDRVLGRGGDDLADGGAGNDLVEGGIGNDRLAGGAGSDVVVGDVGHDVVLGDAGTMTTGDPIQDDADAAGRVTLAEGADDAGSGSVRCAVLIAVLDGQLDMDGDGVTGGDDDGRATGVPVIDGELDIDRSGAIDALDSGILAPYVVATGRVDIDGDGTVGDSDDGSAPYVLQVGSGDADCLLGGDGDDGLFGGSGPDFLLGDDDEDYIAGNGGDDEGRGGDDDDVVRGGPHDDALYGDGDDDDIHGDGGADSIFGGSGTDHLEGNAGSDTIAGEGGPDVLIGGSSAADASDEGDTLEGNVGNDIIIGDNGTATNDGMPELADVTLHDVPSGGAAPVVGEFGDDTIVGGAGVDWAFGGSGDDTIEGDGPGVSNALAGADHLEGNAGSDTIAGQQRADHLIGGSSTATVSDAGDTITGGADADSIVGDNASVQSAGIVLHDLPIVGSPYPGGVSGGDTMWGGDGAAGAGGDLADVIYGQSGADVVHGQLGDDYVEGNQGADTLHGEEGSDDLIGGSGHDQGGTGFAERLLGNVDDALGDTLYGGANGDQLVGDNADVDRPASGPRRVALQNVPFMTATAPAAALSGPDTIWGGDGAASAAGDDTEDLIYGQSGDDVIRGEDGADVVEGGAGADTIHGDAGDDDLTGGSGKDQGGTNGAERLLAGVRDGADVLNGDAGRDLVAGDNAKTWRVSGNHLIQLHDLPIASAALPAAALAGGDTLAGDDDSDEIYGQSGDDTISGGAADDRVEGGDGTDIIRGEGGDDDIVGGSGHDDGGLNGALRELPNIEDDGDRISGGAGVDHLAGDNASQVRVTVSGAVQRRTKLHDLPLLTSPAPDPDTAGDDVLFGDDRSIDPSSGAPAGDLLFGQSDNDHLAGQGGDDDLQGNDGADVLIGNQGGDDLVGGSSRDQGGPAGALRKLANVRDEEVAGVGDILHGDDETASAGSADLGDVLAGDNAYITTIGASDPNRPGTRVRAVELFDVAVAGGYTPSGATAGPDVLSGDANRDLLFGQGEADTLHGDADDDHLEGNHGADTLHGDADRDDLIGGSSVNPGGLVGSMVGGGGFPAATHVADGSDVIYGDGATGISVTPVDNLPDPLTHNGNTGEDAVLGDNGKITRTPAGGVWALHAAPYGSLLRRDLQVPNVDERIGAWSDDRVWAGEGHDEVHGQLGNDTIHGNQGDDTVMGDLGRFSVEVVPQGDARTKRITGDGGFIEEVVFRPFTLFRLTELYRTTTHGGNDLITGGAGNDVVHAGFGQDTVNGHGDILRTDVPDDPATPGSDDPDEVAVAALDAACAADLDQVLPSFLVRGAAGQLGCDEDQLFGDDGDDRMWGGPGHDHLFGGHNPGLGTAGEHLDVVYPGFDPFFHGNVDVDFQGVDFIFGGYGQDALQADRSAPSPNGLDKLIDAAGAYNAYFVCEGAYGGNSVLRVLSPSMLTFLRDLATADGAKDVSSSSSSGFRELALIDRQDMRHNTNPIHPETPGNFVCGDAAR